MSQDPLGSPTSPQKTRKQKQKNSPKKKKRTSFDVSYKMTSTPLPTSATQIDGLHNLGLSEEESLSLLLVSDSPLLNLEGEGGGGGRRGRYGRQKSHTQGSRSAGSVVVGGGTLGKEGGGGVRKDGEVKSADCVKTDGATLTVTSPQQCSFSTSLPNAPASTSLPSVSTLSGSSSHPVPSSPPSSTLSPSPPGLPPFRTPSPSRSPYFAQITPPLGMLDDEENITFPLLPAQHPGKTTLPSLACFPCDSKNPNKKGDWVIEVGKENEEGESKVTLIDYDRYTPYYQHYFFQKEHEVYVGTNSAEDNFIVCVESTKREEDLEVHRRVLVISSKVHSQNNPPTIWAMLPPTKKAILKQLFSAPELGTFLGDAKLLKIENERICDEITKTETNLTQFKYKFGVLLCLEGQTTEEEMLQNNEEPPEFKEFLDHLGTTVGLNGFNGFAGGLDTKHGATGEQSVVHTYQSIQIMYHVSTKLPYDEQDEQQIARKKHIGNDVVVFVYMMGDEPFDPSTFVSEFNHVFITVKKHKHGYHVNVVSRGGVKDIPPLLPDPPLLAPTAKLREFLVVKAINSERVAMYAPKFSARLDFVRKSVISDIVSTFSTPAKKSTKRSYFDLKSKMTTFNFEGTSAQFSDSMASVFRSATPSSPPSSPRSKEKREIIEEEEAGEGGGGGEGGEIKVAKAELEDLEGLVDGLLKELEREPLSESAKATFRVAAIERLKEKSERG